MTIYYVGRLRDVQLIDELMEEVSRIAGTLGWSSEVIDDELRRGVVLQVHGKCEPVALLVDRDGILRRPTEELDKASRHLFVKTQRAPVDVHMAVLTLLRHLKERYFAELDVEDDSGYWDTGTRQAFVKHHACVSVLTDRFAATPANVTGPTGDTADLVERLEQALKATRPGDAETDRDDFLEDNLDAVFPEPLPPDREVLLTWHIDDWTDYFERHDRSRNSFLGFMAGRKETEDEFALALRRSDEEDALCEKRTDRLIRKWEQELGEAREERPLVDDDLGTEREELPEPWRESLPEFRQEDPFECHPCETATHRGDAPSDSPETVTLPRHWASGDWDEIATECPAFDDALELMRAMAKYEREDESESGSPMLRFVKGSISTTIIGVSMGYTHWSRSEGFPLARTARYIIAARRFAQIARVLAKEEEPALQQMAPLARRIASGFRCAAEEGPGGRAR